MVLPEIQEEDEDPYGQSRLSLTSLLLGESLSSMSSPASPQPLPNNEWTLIYARTTDTNRECCATEHVHIYVKCTISPPPPFSPESPERIRQAAHVHDLGPY